MIMPGEDGGLGMCISSEEKRTCCILELNKVIEIYLENHAQYKSRHDMSILTGFWSCDAHVTCSYKMSIKLQISSSEILVLLERAEKELFNGV